MSIFHPETGKPATTSDIAILESTADTVFDTLPASLLCEYSVRNNGGAVVLQIERPNHGLPTKTAVNASIIEQIDDCSEEVLMKLHFNVDGTIEHDVDEEDIGQVMDSAHGLLDDMIFGIRKPSSRRTLEILDKVVVMTDSGEGQQPPEVVDYMRDLVLDKYDSSIEQLLFKHAFENSADEVEMLRTRFMCPGTHEQSDTYFPIEINYSDPDGSQALHYRKTPSGLVILKAVDVGTDQLLITNFAQTLEDENDQYAFDTAAHSNWPRQERVHLLTGRLAALSLESAVTAATMWC